MNDSVFRCADCGSSPASIARVNAKGMICTRCFIKRLEDQAGDAERIARRARASAAGATLYRLLRRS